MKRELLEALQQRVSQNWLIGLDAQELSDRAIQRFNCLIQAKPSKPAILLAEPEPIDFLAGFLAAVAADCSVFLGNPQWSEAEWQQALDRVQPDCIWAGERDLAFNHSPDNSPDKLQPQFLKERVGSFPNGTIGIPTGGSSGQIRFALHSWETLTASVAGFRAYFEIDRVNSCCVLPLFHVSGLMQFIRSFYSDGRFALFAAKALEQQIGQIDSANFCISLVPTQLQRLVDNPENLDWLRQFQMILLGGAPAWSSLLETARLHRLPVALTYGMTETASQVVALKPADFLQGRSGCGQTLPHAQIEICDAQGNLAEPGAIGTIRIRARSLCQGYLGMQLQPQLLQPLVTDDLGYFDADRYLHLVGRNSQKIITGGENVFPAEVEATIRATGFVQDVCVVGLPDSVWGEAVTAVIVPIADCSIVLLQAVLRSKLSRHKQPKRWVVIDRIPRSEQGKVNYAQIRQMAQERGDRK